MDEHAGRTAPAESGQIPQPASNADDLYENAPCGYLSTLPNGTILSANQTFLTWTGHRREDLVGVRRFHDLLTVGGRVYHETHHAPLLQMQGEVREIAFDIVCADNRRLPVLVNSALLRDPSGEPRLTTLCAIAGPRATIRTRIAYDRVLHIVVAVQLRLPRSGMPPTPAGRGQDHHGVPRALKPHLSDVVARQIVQDAR